MNLNIKTTAMCYNLYIVLWLANMTRMHVVTGSSLMTDTIETAVYPY